MSCNSHATVDEDLKTISFLLTAYLKSFSISILKLEKVCDLAVLGVAADPRVAVAGAVLPRLEHGACEAALAGGETARVRVAPARARHSTCAQRERQETYHGNLPRARAGRGKGNWHGQQAQQ